MHARRQIRHAIEALVSGLPTTGSRVYPSRVYPYGNAELPGLSVYTLAENVVDSEFNGDQLRTLAVVIEARVKQNVGYDDTLDTIAEEVEKAIAADKFLLTLPEPVKLTVLSDVSFEMSDELEKPTGLMTMTYEVSYRVNENDPSILID